MIRILLVEDHASFGQALAGMAGLEEGLEVVGHVTRGEEAAAAATAGQVDVAIVDLDLPGGPGVDAIAALRQQRPPVACVVLTALTDDVELGRAVQAGAAAVLHKSVAIAELFAIVRSVAAGHNRLDPAATTRWLSALAAARESGWRSRVVGDSLSPREREVLALLARGKRAPTIAETLGIAEGTVASHVRSLRAKLGVGSQLEAVAEALRLGLVDPPN